MGNTYTYDAENRLLTVAGANTASYVYNVQGQRVRATVNGSAKDFIFDQAGRAITEVNSTSWIRSELYAGSHVATYYNSTTYFEHSDWLGTVRARSGVSGTPAETCTSLPFGDAQSCTGTDWSPLHFTGQPWDSESNLHHFWFRQYSTTEGRWTSPDPAGLAAVNIANPQTWNRYAYVLNNPGTFQDLLGLMPGLLGCAGAPRAFCNDGSGGGGGGGGSLPSMECRMEGIDVPCDLVYGALESGAAVVCLYNYCGPVPIPGAGFAFPSYAADGSINWSFSFEATSKGVQLTDATLAEMLGLPSDLVAMPGLPSNLPQGAANSGGNSTGVCSGKILSAVNNQFGTSFTSGDVQGKPLGNGGATNINILGTGLPAGQFNSIQPGRYPESPLTWLIGYGPTLHVTGKSFLNPTALFQNSNIGGLTSVTFTAHIDYGFPFNPFGALYHLFHEVLHLGGQRKPC